MKATGTDKLIIRVMPPVATGGFFLQICGFQGEGTPSWNPRFEVTSFPEQKSRPCLNLESGQ
jgi:hypothetical protein